MHVAASAVSAVWPERFDLAVAKVVETPVKEVEEPQPLESVELLERVEKVLDRECPCNFEYSPPGNLACSLFETV
jgi:hypothetical protein